MIYPTVLHDFCENDYFQAECPSGTIVFIEEARYGRMELGTCVTEAFGYLDCYRYFFVLWQSNFHLMEIRISIQRIPLFHELAL